MPGFLRTSRGLAATTVVACVGCGIVGIAEPKALFLPAMLIGLVTLWVGGIATVVVPRLTLASLLNADRRRDALPRMQPSWFRRRFWWSISWELTSPVDVDLSASTVKAFLSWRKETKKWPFGDPTTKLVTQPEGFSTAPGWLWNMPFKPVLTGWAEAVGAGSRVRLVLRMTTDPPLEILFLAVCLIMLGAGVAILFQDGVSAWPAVPLTAAPFALVLVVGQIGRWHLRRRALALIGELEGAVHANATRSWPGWA